VIVGRGRLAVRTPENLNSPTWASGDTDAVFLRMERVGGWVRALCSADGTQWFTVGSVEFPPDVPVQVGLHAIGEIDRTVYHDAHLEGTAVRFKSFALWGT
jgi:hypothetical protein